MRTDSYGRQIYTEEDLCSLYLKDPNINLKNVLMDEPVSFPIDLDLDNLPKIIPYTEENTTLQEFDAQQQQAWFLPESYHTFDIAAFVLEQCTTEEELQRAGQELLLYQERDMMMLLRYLKFFVDTMRKHKIVWGVGRGSSVSSFVLFLIGVHKINSLYYGLSIDEFLK